MMGNCNVFCIEKIQNGRDDRSGLINNHNLYFLVGNLKENLPFHYQQVLAYQCKEIYHTDTNHWNISVI